MTDALDLCNKALICELEEEVGQNVLFLMADGWKIFGKLLLVEDKRTAMLGPAPGPSTFAVNAITLLGPAGTIFEANTGGYIQVDLTAVVAKATGLTSSPLEIGSGATLLTSEDININAEIGYRSGDLKSLIGQILFVNVLGGFQFVFGRLSKVVDDVAVLVNVTAVSPGACNFLTTTLDSVNVNIKSITFLTVLGGTTIIAISCP